MHSLIRPDRSWLLCLVAVTFWCSPLSVLADGNLSSDWPQFRGRAASGLADGPPPPAKWDVETGENILWKADIPGLGHASPIVSRGHIFVVTALSENSDLRIGLYGDIAPVDDDSEHDWRLLCLSQTSGRILWERSLHVGVPTIKRHTKASHANSTPATDGHHVVTMLASEGLFCHDFAGNLIWKRDLGTLDSGFFMVPDAQWGFAASPIIHKGRVIIQADVQKDSFLAALDVHTGEEIWRTKRTDVPTWSTPAVARVKNRDVIVVNGFRKSAGYDAADGSEIWSLAGGGDIPVPTPVFGHGNVYLSSAHGFFRPLRAVRLEVEGAIPLPKLSEKKKPSPHFAWYEAREGIYQGTPLVYGDNLYACRGNGLLSCFDAKTGERKFRDRLNSGDSGFTASPVAAGQRIYFASESGTVSVVEHGDEFKLLAKNYMQSYCMATPAISHGVLYVRTNKALYAIGKPTQHALAKTSRPVVRCQVAQCRPCRCCRCVRRRQPKKSGVISRVWRRLFGCR